MVCNPLSQRKCGQQKEEKKFLSGRERHFKTRVTAGGVGPRVEESREGRGLDEELA